MIRTCKVSGTGSSSFAQARSKLKSLNAAGQRIGKPQIDLWVRGTRGSPPSFAVDASTLLKVDITYFEECGPMGKVAVLHPEIGCDKTFPGWQFGRLEVRIAEGPHKSIAGRRAGGVRVERLWRLGTLDGEIRENCEPHDAEKSSQTLRSHGVSPSLITINSCSIDLPLRILTDSQVESPHPLQILSVLSANQKLVARERLERPAKPSLNGWFDATSQ
jgi:hypothetical protein